MQLTLDGMAATMPAIDARDYQTEARDAVLAAIAAPPRRALVNLPTGTGKTILFALLAKHLQVRTLILAHTEELLTQAKEKILRVWPECSVGIVGAGFEECGRLVTIGSVQAIKNEPRLRALVRQGVDLIIVDEAHHAVASTYQKILDAFPGAAKVGVTATVDRGDGDDITAVFGAPVYRRGLLWMIEHDPAYLVEPRGVRVYTTTNLDDVKTRGGDFVESSLAETVNTRQRNDTIVNAWKERAADRPTIVFAADVAHAFDLAESFARAGFKAAAVSGETPKDERRALLAAAHKGELQVLCNCAVLTEGFDWVEASCIVLARPTKSRPLYAQMVGRGLRLAPAKEDCLILDVCDNSTKHRLDVAGLPCLVGSSYAEADRAGKKTNGATLREIFYAEGEAKAASVILLHKWVRVVEGGRVAYKLPLGPEGAAGVIWLVLRDDDGFIIGMVWSDGHRQILNDRPQALDVAQDEANRRADLIEGGKASFVDDRAPWRSALASEKQRAILDRFRIRYNAATLTKGDASKLIDAKFAALKAAGKWRG